VVFVLVVILQYGIVNVKQKKSGEKLFVAAKMARGPPPMPKRQPASLLGSAAWLVSF